MGLSLNFTNRMAPSEREQEDDVGVNEKEMNAFQFLKVHLLNLKVQDVSLHFDFNTQ